MRVPKPRSTTQRLRAGKPVLFTQNGQQAITYLRVYIEQGHQHPGIRALSAEQRTALDAPGALRAPLNRTG
jgi:hypothetical protein